MSRRTAVLIAAGALALGAGCGGDDEEQPETTAGAITTTQAKTATQDTAAKGKQPQRTTRSAPQPTTPNTGPTPGAKSVAPGVPVSPGGDNSVQLYGAEGEVDQRQQAIATVRIYLNARAAGQWSRACALISSELKQGLKQLAGGAQPDNENASKGCAGALRLLTNTDATVALRRIARVDRLLSFRVEGDQAFLIFKSGEKAKFMPMDNEDGEWKVAGIEPSEFFLGVSQPAPSGAS